MCGIVGYVGYQNASPILLDGLKTLEYRGYDSAGIFIVGDQARKAVGAVSNLIEKIPEDLSGTVGIAHTRWATHGLPTEANAHPHRSADSSVWIVHNGIIENYKELRDELGKEPYASETDTEVLAHLIGHFTAKGESFENAVVSALQKVRGTYGLVAVSTKEPDTIIAARLGSPIVLGVGNNEYFVASDPSAILRHTKDVVYLHDGEYAVLTKKGYSVYTLNRVRQERIPDHIEWDVEQAKKGGYPHFMLKEIMEIPDVLLNSARGRLLVDEGSARLGGLLKHEADLRQIQRLVIVACGSASFTGLYGKHIIEEYAGIPVDPVIGSEFRYSAYIPQAGTAVLAVSQSGETADTLASIKESKHRGLLTLGIVNVVGSTIARETDAGIYNHAGPEISVASTKAVVSQMEILALLALFLGRQRHLSVSEGKRLATGIASLPDLVRKILTTKDRIEEIARRYSGYRNFLYIGRKYNYGAAFEGALKLKEISYIHAESYGAGEMKHGAIAMIDPDFPTVAIVPKDSMYEKMISNIQEIKARSGKVIAIATEGDAHIAELADDVIYIPETIESLNPILAVVPMQLFGYYVGVAKGYNVDRPRNLAKSVTVE